MVTPTRLIAGNLLSAAWATVYTVPTSAQSATAKQLVLCNTDTQARTFYYAVIPSGGSNGAQYIMFNGATIQSNETRVFGLTDVMPQGTYIQVKAGEAGGGNLVSITLSGMENS